MILRINDGAFESTLSNLNITKYIGNTIYKMNNKESIAVYKFGKQGKYDFIYIIKLNYDFIKFYNKLSKNDKFYGILDNFDNIPESLVISIINELNDFPNKDDMFPNEAIMFSFPYQLINFIN